MFSLGAPDKVQLKLLLQKQLSTKPTRQLMRFVWRTETMVLPDHKLWQQQNSLKTVKLIQSFYQGRNYALQSKDSHYLMDRKTLGWSLPSQNAILHS